MGTEENRAVWDWDVCGATVEGASHTRSGLTNQDRIFWKQKGEDNPSILLAVADGHGSAMYFRSASGAQFAVDIALAEMEESISPFPFPLDEKNIPAVNAILQDLPATIVKKWQQTVMKDWEATGSMPTPAEWNRLKAEQKVAEVVPRVDKNPLLAYGATLLAVMVTQSFIFYCQLGDGDIQIVTESGQVITAVKDDARLLANETTSLCSTTPDLAKRDFRTTFRDINELSKREALPALILVSTDGYSNSFNTQEAFHKVGRDIVGFLSEEGGGEKVKNAVKGWLQAATKAGSGDDISLGLIWNQEYVDRAQKALAAIPPPPPPGVPSSNNQRTQQGKSSEASNEPRHSSGTQKQKWDQEPFLRERVVSPDSKAPNIFNLISKPMAARPWTRVPKEGHIQTGPLPAERGSASASQSTPSTDTRPATNHRPSEINHAPTPNGQNTKPAPNPVSINNNADLQQQAATSQQQANNLSHQQEPQVPPQQAEHTESPASTQTPAATHQPNVEKQEAPAQTQTPATVEKPRAEKQEAPIPAQAAAATHQPNVEKQGVSQADEHAKPPIRPGMDRSAKEPFARYQPGTRLLVVRQQGAQKGEYKTIKDALKDAGDGAWISVYPGTYEGQLHIKRDIIIHCEEESGRSVEVIGNAPCLQISAHAALIQGMYINSTKGKDTAAVEITEGQSTLRSCFISSASSVCVSIQGKTTKPTLRDCSIRDGQGTGVIVSEGAQGLLENCEIVRQQGIGIEIRASAPTIRRCNILHNRAVGLLIGKDAAGLIELCRITNHRYTNIEIRDGGKPILVECFIASSEDGPGIQFFKQGRGIILACAIESNKGPGILLDQQGKDVQIKRCTIAKNGVGIQIQAQADGEAVQVDNCTIVKNGTGIQMQEQVTATIVESQVAYNSYREIGVYYESHITLKKVTITSILEKDYAVVLFGGSQGTFKGCTIQTQEKGIALQDHVTLHLDDCSLSSQTSYTLCALKGSNAMLRNCTLYTDNAALHDTVYSEESEIHFERG